MMPSVATMMANTPTIWSAPCIESGSIEPSRIRFEALAITARETVIATTLTQVIKSMFAPVARLSLCNIGHHTGCAKKNLELDYSLHRFQIKNQNK
jgi:hypothetical protein